MLMGIIKLILGCEKGKETDTCRVPTGPLKKVNQSHSYNLKTDETRARATRAVG